MSLRKDGHVGGEFFGTKKVIQFIVDNIPGTNKVSKKKDCKGYYHSFSGNGLSVAMYNDLYDNCEICLKRKADRFKLAFCR